MCAEAGIIGEDLERKVKCKNLTVTGYDRYQVKNHSQRELWIANCLQETATVLMMYKLMDFCKAVSLLCACSWQLEATVLAMIQILGR